MADKKPSNREQIKQIVAGIEDSIQQIFQSERYMDYLRTMSRFHSYSVCQRRCGFVVFRRTEKVEKWRVKVYSL